MEMKRDRTAQPVPASELEIASGGGRILNSNGHDFDHYDYGLCPACGRWQQLIDWRGTHRLTCPARAERAATHYYKVVDVAALAKLG